MFAPINQSALVWMSSGGTKSVVHYDDADNLNCLISGQKRMVFWSPGEYGPHRPLCTQGTVLHSRRESAVASFGPKPSQDSAAVESFRKLRAINFCVVTVAMCVSESESVRA